MGSEIEASLDAQQFEREMAAEATVRLSAPVRTGRSAARGPHLECKAQRWPSQRARHQELSLEHESSMWEPPADAEASADSSPPGACVRTCRMHAMRVLGCTHRA
jgi:hypothetical protein